MQKESFPLPDENSFVDYDEEFFDRMREDVASLGSLDQQWDTFEENVEFETKDAPKVAHFVTSQKTHYEIHFGKVGISNYCSEERCISYINCRISCVLAPRSRIPRMRRKWAYQREELPSGNFTRVIF